MSGIVNRLLEKGCEVVGVELVKQACDEFFQEQLMEYDLLTLEGLPVYKVLVFHFDNNDDVVRSFRRLFARSAGAILKLFNN